MLRAPPPLHAAGAAEAEPLGKLLRHIRLRVEGFAVEHDGGPLYAAALHIAGLLLQAEAVHAQAVADGLSFEGDGAPPMRAGLRR